MKKLRKKILGTIGLVLVIAMTLVAYSIPNPAVAVEPGGSFTDTIVVKVYDKYAETHPVNLHDGDILVENPFELIYEYINSEKIYYELNYSPASEDESTIPENILIDYWTDITGTGDPAHIPEGNKTRNLPLERYGKYILSWHAYSGVPSLDSEGSLEFYRYPVRIEHVDQDEKEAEMFDIYFNDDVENLEIQIFDKNGNPIFPEPLKYKDDIGHGIVVEIPEESIGDQVTHVRISIEMPEGYGEGDYTIGVLARDDSGSAIFEPIYETFHFVPAPEVPDTGSFMKGLNLAKSDYLITGLIIFFSAAIGAIILLNRKRSASR